MDAIGIVSEDPTQSLAFYQLLGVEFKRYEDTDHYEAVTASGLRLLLDSSALIKSFHPEWKKPSGSGVTLCFKQASPEAVNVLYEQITHAGHRSIMAPWDAFWGQRYACVADPDGNQIDLFASL